MKIQASQPQGWRAAWNKGLAVLLQAHLPGRFSAQDLAQAWCVSKSANPFFLLETPSGPQAKRFSLLAGEPLFVLEGRGSKAWIVRGRVRVPLRLAPEQALARLGRALKAQGVAGQGQGGVPLLGGLSYEAGARFEPWRLPKAEPLGLPDWLWILPSRWMQRRGSGQAWTVTQLAPSPAFLAALAKALGMTAPQLRALSAEPEASHLEGWLLGLQSRVEHPLPRSTTRARAGRIKDNATPQRFARMIRRAQSEISAGEYYQANLSHRLQAAFDGDAFAFYQRLLHESPSPMSAYADLGGVQVISASPERLFRQRGSRIETWPIAGTAANLGKRGEAAALRASAKDAAEHVMLVDLERNDLGRVSAMGSVKVPKFKTVETYAHVHHLVSQVSGTLAPGKDFFDLLRAGFPGGSITGAPKSRVLKAIAELEGERRGWYTGALGYWDPWAERADMNILIRGAIAKEGRLTWSVGSGIVADSQAAAEWRETLAKGKAIVKVLRAKR